MVRIFATILIIWQHPSLTAHQLLQADTPREAALVVGVSRYNRHEVFSDLPNCGNDLERVTQYLDVANVDVTSLPSPSIHTLRKAMKQFVKHARGVDVMIVYLSSHGVMVGDETYICPKDADIMGRRDLRNKTMSVGEICSIVKEAHASACFIIVDACRAKIDWLRYVYYNPPYDTALPPNTMLVFAVSPGEKAPAGEGMLSTFTSCWLGFLCHGELSLNEGLVRAAAALQVKTHNTLHPAVSGTLSREIFLFPTKGK